MFEITKVPFKTLIAAEKIIGRNVITLSQKPDKTFEDLRDFAFVVKYCEDTSYTLDKANELSMEDLTSMQDATAAKSA